MTIGKSMAKSAKTSATKKPPKGWFMAGLNPELYEASVDSSHPHSGTKCAHIRSGPNVKNARQWATLMQQIGPLSYRNKRVRMSFWVRTKDVESWVQPWMRIDGPEQGKSLSFDNMCGRRIKEAADWTEHNIVLDVPEESTNIAFGIMLGGKGDVWFDDVSFDAVGKNVPVTDCPCSRNSTDGKKPQNLNFEEGEEDDYG